MVSRFSSAWNDSAQRDFLLRVSERAVLWMIWLHSPLAMWGGRLAAISFAIAVALWAAVAALAVAWPGPGRPASRTCPVAALWALSALALLETTGQAWRTDACLSFFALLGIAAALNDAKAVYVSAGLVALHDIVLRRASPAISAGAPDSWQPPMLLFEAISTAWLLRRATRAVIAAEAESTVARLPWLGRIAKKWRLERRPWPERRVSARGSARA